MKKMILKRFSEDLDPKTLNYQDWKLVILFGSGRFWGMLLSFHLCGVEQSHSQCLMVNFAWISSHLHLLQVLNFLPCRVQLHQITLR